MPANQTRHLLFLDDDPDFLDALESMIPDRMRQQWRVFLAPDAARALALLRKHPIDLVVSDLDMPVVDGLQFLQLLHQVCPDPRKVVLSSHSGEDYRKECLARGAVLFLKKPDSADGFESIFRMLNEILEWRPPRGFSGLLRSVTLSDLVQLETISRTSSILQISTGGICGTIYIEEGRLIHAETEDLEGADAFIELVNLQTGGFVVQPYREPPRRTIEASCDGLLLEAAQRFDEERTENGGLSEMLSSDLSISEVMQKASICTRARQAAGSATEDNKSRCFAGAC